MIEAFAYSRAGLLGNPSDGYFGKTISVSVRNFAARVSLEECDDVRVEAGLEDRGVFRSLGDLVERVTLHGYLGGTPLVLAAIKRFHDHCRAQGIPLADRGFTARYDSDIPRQVGLAGSSAIVTATMRALARFFEVEIDVELLPTLVLEAETEELGIRAGLQDRVIQAWEGCVYMDFDRALVEATGHGRYERLEPGLLPDLFVAYDTRLGKVSGRVHDVLRARYDAGDPDVAATLARIADLAAAGREALLAGDRDRLFDLVNENFDLRAKVMTISPENRNLVETARRCGAAAKFAGSGGAIVGIVPDGATFERLREGLGAVGATVIRPEVGEARVGEATE